MGTKYVNEEGVATEIAVQNVTAYVNALGVTVELSGPTWDALVASLAPWQWLKLDDAATGTTAADASGNGRTGSYPNGGNAGFPNRQEPPLVDNSGFSLISGGNGNSELITPAAAALNTLFSAGSFTFGGVVASTITAALTYQWSMGGVYPLSLSFNRNGAATTSGALMFRYDSGGGDNDQLSVTNTGWNDGNNHLLLCEYDSVADTISIWLDGVEIATRTRPGTKPVSGTFTGQAFAILGPANNTTGMKLDEWLMFDKALTAQHHADLAEYIL